MDKAIFGDQTRFGYFRFGVLLDTFDRFVAQFEKATNCTADVTKRELQLDSQDSVTGWFTKIWVETTIKMPIIPKSSQSLLTGMGSYVRMDALGVHCDPIKDGDEIMDANGTYYQVKAVREHKTGNSLVYRECDLVYLSLHE